MAMMDWPGGGDGMAAAYNPTGRRMEEVITNGFDDVHNDIKQHEDRLAALETRLFILHKNVEMERLYPELKEAYARYKEIEAKILTFHTLKTSE